MQHVQIHVGIVLTVRMYVCKYVNTKMYRHKYHMYTYVLYTTHSINTAHNTTMKHNTNTIITVLLYERRGTHPEVESGCVHCT